MSNTAYTCTSKLLVKLEEINITGLKVEIRPDILDSQYPLKDLEKFFIKIWLVCS